MKIKLIVAMVNEEKTDPIIDAARANGATGATVITSVRGEGMNPGKTFFGLDLVGQRDMLLFLVVEQKARIILEAIAEAGKLDEEKGAGVAFQIDIEDAMGLGTQIEKLFEEIEEEL